MAEAQGETKIQTQSPEPPRTIHEALLLVQRMLPYAELEFASPDFETLHQRVLSIFDSETARRFNVIFNGDNQSARKAEPLHTYLFKRISSRILS